MVWGTNRVQLAVVMHHGSLIIGPKKTCSAVIERSAGQRNFGVHCVFHDRSGSPRSDQRTARNKNQVFHAINAQVVVLCPGIPTDHIISDVVLERFCTNDVFATAPGGKRQKGSESAIPEFIRDTFRTAKNVKSTEVVREGPMAYSSGLLAWILEEFGSVET